VGSFDFFLKIHKARKAQIYIEASWCGVYWILLKSLFSGVRWDHN
jgi:hypothetical protein